MLQKNAKASNVYEEWTKWLRKQFQKTYWPKFVQDIFGKYTINYIILLAGRYKFLHSVAHYVYVTVCIRKSILAVFC